MKDFFLEFLTRPGCHLCDDALPTARRVAAVLRADLIERPIDDDDVLVRDFGVRIPVVRDPSGAVLAEGIIEPGPLLRAALRSRLRHLR